MESHLRAGVAIYNAGHYHAAHDAWEDRWLDMDEGDRKDALQGLIQFTAAVYHTTQDNDEGARGLAESALQYLDGQGETFEGVTLGSVREALGSLAADPTDPGPEFPPPLRYRGDRTDLTDLDLEATLIAAPILADELGYDDAMLADAVGYAREDVDERGRSLFVSLVFDFVRRPENRPIITQRLGEHVQRRRQRDRDVEGLF